MEIEYINIHQDLQDLSKTINRWHENCLHDRKYLFQEQPHEIVDINIILVNLNLLKERFKSKEDDLAKIDQKLIHIEEENSHTDDKISI
jgi:Mg2+/Co2+ transporter CorB